MGYAHGRQWTEEEIIKEIKNVMNTLGLEKRIPSYKEYKMVLGDYSLNNAISRRGGNEHFRKILNLEEKESETRLGIEGEKQIKTILENKEYKVEITNLRHPYDLLVNDNIKIDIKTSKKHNTKGKYNIYRFNLEKEKPTCDLYILNCLDDNKILIIPSKYLKQEYISIGENSKYDVYKDRFDYIKKYDEFYKSI